MNIFLIQASALFIFMNLWFLAAIIKKRNDIADIAWGLGFILLALIGLFLNPTARTALIALAVFIWGSRLAWHIGIRFKKSRTEDRRYQKMRAGWNGSQVFNSWLRVFMLQGALLFLVAAGIITASIYSQEGLNIINIIGFLLWLFGFSFEVIGDRQLKNFLSRSENKGKIMASGLWKYTRHPNYFGEAALWWGVWLMVFGTDYFALAIISPLAITILLRYISGVPLAEAGYKDNSEYREYAKKTPAMLPNFFGK